MRCDRNAKRYQRRLKSKTRAREREREVGKATNQAPATVSSLGPETSGHFCFLSTAEVSGNQNLSGIWKRFLFSLMAARPARKTRLMTSTTAKSVASEIARAISKSPS